MEKAGKIQKTFGSKGELLAFWQGAKPTPDMPLWIDIEGLQVPFFALHAEEKGGKMLLIFEDMETEALAQSLVGKEIWVNRNNKSSTLSSSCESEACALVGYALHDKHLGAVGIVEQWLDYPNNPCLEVRLHKGGTALVPAHPDLMTRIEVKKKILYMNLPQGLID